MPDRKFDVAGFDDSSVEPGVWRYAHANRATLVVDAEDYFDLMQQAMLKAEQRVLLIGWDFDTRIHLSKGRRWWQKGWRSQFPRRLGSFILWLARHRQGLEIRILKWSVGTLKFFTRGSMLLDILRWWPNRQIDFKFDSTHPIGCSHHQKLAIIDERFAVCGGIDMTSGRWDTRSHFEQDERRKAPGGHPYPPWHDLTMLMEGEVARTLADLGHWRWVRAGGKDLPRCRPQERTAWPEELPAHFENVEIGIARSRSEYGEFPAVNEIEQLFIRQICAARRFIYAENQYFASRAIGEAIARRMAEPDPPEVVIVNPASADGWVEAKAMDPARTELLHAIREVDTKGRFHLYVPYAGETPVYVHAKLMIVDDAVIRVGSANFNNRSMGLDSECDVFIDCERPGNGHVRDQIRRLRISLLAEHCKTQEPEMEELLDRHGSMSAAIASLADSPQGGLRLFDPEPLDDIEAELAGRQMLDPEHPDEMFAITPRRRGLFRPGSLLARAKARMTRKRRSQ